MAVTHYELDAKLEAIETRMDGRVQHIQQIFEHMQGDLLAIKTDNQTIRQELKEDYKDIKQELRNAKWWALGTSIAIISVLVGVLALTNSWQQTTISLIASKADNIQNKLDNLQRTH